MKKIVVTILSAILVFSLSACGINAGGVKTPATPVPETIVEAAPTDILKPEEIAAAVGYTPVLDGEVQKEGNASAVIYRSEPVGKQDTVKVVVRQYTKDITKEQVKAQFDDMKAKRTKTEDVDGIQDCYIAYPSIHFYKDGYHIQITAGSGSDDAQSALLKKLAESASTNLNSLLENGKK